MGKIPRFEVLSVKHKVRWQDTYAAIKKMRSMTVAPVDTMGCDKLADSLSPKTYRFQTLIALMLSSQTKDSVNASAMQRLKTELKGGLTIDDILQIEEEKLAELLKPVGFYRRKAEYIIRTAIILRAKYEDDIPDTVDGLTQLPGVGPKMAYLAMQCAWMKNEGIGVDVHVHRISNRLGWVKSKTPEGTRKQLECWLPRDRWAEINHMLVGFGQTICLPRNPRCKDCALRNSCPSSSAKEDTLF